MRVIKEHKTYVLFFVLLGISLSLKPLVIKSIDMYQSQISNNDGRHCLYSKVHKTHSCSGFTKRKIIEHGLFKGLYEGHQRSVQCKILGSKK